MNRHNHRASSIEYRALRIKNPTLAHFRHFSPLLTNLSSTIVENVRQINFFLQNKPNFPRFSNEYVDYAKKQTQFKPNTNPIKANFGPISKVVNPIQTQTNPFMPEINVPSALIIDDCLYSTYNENDKF